jgi:hypothetical protein
MLRHEIPFQCLVRLREDTQASLPRLPGEDWFPSRFPHNITVVFRDSRSLAEPSKLY